MPLKAGRKRKTETHIRRGNAMKARWVVGMGLVLFLVGSLPASAQMMGGQGGMMGSGMTDMMGRGGLG
jgi:hypothetical protein